MDPSTGQSVFAFLKKKICADINNKYDEMKNYVKTHRHNILSKKITQWLS